MFAQYGHYVSLVLAVINRAGDCRLVRKSVIFVFVLARRFEAAPARALSMFVIDVIEERSNRLPYVAAFSRLVRRHINDQFLTTYFQKEYQCCLVYRTYKPSLHQHIAARRAVSQCASALLAFPPCHWWRVCEERPLAYRIFLIQLRGDLRCRNEHVART